MTTKAVGMKVARLNWFEQYFMAQISPNVNLKENI
jgi:hypothetical protein